MTGRATTSGPTGATGDVCVSVVGMHRSGTSAVTELLGRMGLALPLEHDRIPATDSNRHGHFESRQLVAFDHRLLLRLGGSWAGPPDLPAGWEHSGELGDLRDEASRCFALAFPRRPAAWKDPRLCLLLPFWRAVLAQPVAAIFVYRDPAEVAASLQERDGLGPLHAHALWERYVRVAGAGLDGLPTLAADYDRVLDDPPAWCAQVADFLAGVGVTTRALDAEDVRGVLDPGLRRRRAGPDDAGDTGAGARAVFEALGAFGGPHASWRPPDLGDEPGWVADVLGMRRRLDMLEHSLRDVERSRAYRLGAWVRGHRRSA